MLPSVADAPARVGPDLATVHALVADFLASHSGTPPWVTPEGARSHCFLASLLFGAYAARRGHVPVVVLLDGRRDAFPGGCYAGAFGAELNHCVVLLDGVVLVDLTARQFDAALPFPLIEASPDGIPTFWGREGVEHSVAWDNWAEEPVG